MARELRRYAVRGLALAAALILAIVALAAWQQSVLRASQQAADFDRARAVQALVETQAREDLIRRSELVADDTAFAGYVETAIGGALPGVPVDTTSLVDLLKERQERLGFALTAVLDQNGRVLGTTSTLLPDGARERSPVFVAARDSDATVTGVWSGAGGLYHVAVVPLSAVGISDGFLLTGVPLGRAYADAVSRAGVDASLVSAGATPAGSAARDGVQRLPVFGSPLASIEIRARAAAGGRQARLPWAVAMLWSREWPCSWWPGSGDACWCPAR